MTRDGFLFLTKNLPDKKSRDKPGNSKSNRPPVFFNSFVETYIFMINRDTSKEELEHIFYDYMERYFTSFDKKHLGMLKPNESPIDTKSHDIAMVAHNELVRRSNERLLYSNEEFARSNERFARWNKKFSVIAVVLTVITIVLAGVTIWYNQADMHSDEAWQQHQLQLLEHIKQNTRDNETLRKENNRLQGELYKAELMLRAYEQHDSNP